MHESNYPAKVMELVPLNHQRTASLVPNYRMHTALRDGPKVALSAQGWKNVNRAIEKTVLGGFGSDCWEMDEGFGVVPVAEIRRKIKEDCTLDNPRLHKKLRGVAHDVTVTKFSKATQPMTGTQQIRTLLGASMIPRGTGGETGAVARGDGPA
ncbi:hypothetical protein F4814DRAFT_458479 [Daldinia grandis]|nr:hypothetical protein F4814DRAFT_458479 [Daldinia grandis]